MTIAGWVRTVGALLLAGCPAQNVPQPIPPPPVPTAGWQPLGEAPGLPASNRALGAACDLAAQCASGICEGLGCGPGQGVCADLARACTEDDQPYCGCDGATFTASSSCPAARFAAPGPCKVEVGGACRSADECASGVCEGQGCGDGALGVCASRDRVCATGSVSFCGCDGLTFAASATCPGRRFSARAACP